MPNSVSHIHHYVPQWYQKRFLSPGESKLHVLDLNPDIIKLAGGTTRTHNAYRLQPVSKCFYSDDLYMLRFGATVTDSIERRFFGLIDKRGSVAVDTFSGITGFSRDFAQSQGDIPPYLGAQRFRTPRGLDWLQRKVRTANHNQTLFLMGESYQQHTTMWAEGIWELVRARNTQTKFIISDEPVTFYNSKLPPSNSVYPGTEELELVGTRTLFPLSPDNCLVITHLQFTRNPTQDPKQIRINARRYDQVMMYAGNVQFDRELEEDEVIRINAILKAKATRFIAAGRKDWLYPEEQVKCTGWAVLDNDWFLLPNLWKVPFSKSIVAGFGNGSAWAADEYGRHPGHPLYDNDQARRDREWAAKRRSQRKWAKLRAGKSLSRTYDLNENTATNRMLAEYLSAVGKKETLGQH